MGNHRRVLSTISLTNLRSEDCADCWGKKGSKGSLKNSVGRMVVKLRRMGLQERTRFGPGLADGCDAPGIRGRRKKQG